MVVASAVRRCQLAYDGQWQRCFWRTTYFSQGCQATSLYSPTRVSGAEWTVAALRYRAAGRRSVTMSRLDPYAGTTQSTNLARYRIDHHAQLPAKNDTRRIQCRLQRHAGADAHVADRLQSGFSVVDRGLQPLRHGAGNLCERSCPGYLTSPIEFHARSRTSPERSVFCDPQLGCSDRLVAQDLRTNMPGS